MGATSGLWMVRGGEKEDAKGFLGAPKVSGSSVEVRNLEAF